MNLPAALAVHLSKPAASRPSLSRAKQITQLAACLDLGLETGEPAALAARNPVVFERRGLRRPTGTDLLSTTSPLFTVAVSLDPGGWLLERCLGLADYVTGMKPTGGRPLPDGC